MREDCEGAIQKITSPARCEKQRRAQARRRGTRRTEKCGLAILVQSRGSVLQLFVIFLGSQVMKSLEEIGFEHYYHAEQTGWVLYLEGSTDLAILRAFAPKNPTCQGRRTGARSERPGVGHGAVPRF
jgi:hypothetical protein